MATSHTLPSSPGSRPGRGDHKNIPDFRESNQTKQHEAVYEPPMLIEAGDFAQLTRGSGLDSLDAFDYYCLFFWWR
ncbi:MAG: lasso RiPP family leader peptide-containing protein [Egibacteraceae bacterium]